MPEPHRAYAGNPPNQRMGEEARPPGQRKRARQTKKQQARHNQQKQDVLQHVRAKKITFSKRIEW